MALPDIYAGTPVAIAPSQTLVTLPVNTFLENLAIAPTGKLLITSHEAGEIITLDRENNLGLYAKLEGKVTGIALIEEDSLLINGWNAESVPFVAILADGEVQFLQTLPGALFLNGITPISANQYLMADSYRGAIWSFDLITQTANIWLEHPLLARADSNNPFPGANGLKRFGDVLYVSNTEQKRLVRIPLDDNHTPQEPEIFVEGTNLDDFAFDIHGNLYGTTHVYNSVVRIEPDGNTTIIAEAEQGVTGCTAVAFYGTGLYVVNNGGMSYPPPGGVEPAQIVRLELGVEGAPLLSKG
ncbi:SMP-30/gluconolactonase/LRE family protein [Nodosilinea sp. LEGE 07088]|uniref:SMP-30/gluconolactonase/LRE family protein n=1 Tax=Nodosilinea sp. LEGE 07088 TaxID=2777968 RepID=UPI001882E51D|nr:SMP-30/gluconolactonase/LRE family protein [Nodosilinea sp. LEGE 07088]MBE9136530.1 SMP-30/gluconolactonase/LRE family protein [Nodosilinea sp. LEGE 07088]